MWQNDNDPSGNMHSLSVVDSSPIRLSSVLGTISHEATVAGMTNEAFSRKLLGRNEPRAQMDTRGLGGSTGVVHAGGEKASVGMVRHSWLLLLLLVLSPLLVSGQARRTVLPRAVLTDITTATSLSTSFYVGDTALGTCHYTTTEGVVIEAACDAAKTTLYTSDITMHASGPMHLRNADGDICATWNELTGRVTYAETGTCQRPVISRPFDASAFNVGAGVTLESVALNGWPGAPALDGPDSDAGLFSLVIPILWADLAPGGAMTLQLACHSLTNQNGQTLVVRVGAAVCAAPGEALAAYSAPTTGPTLTCTFGDQTDDVQMSNVVTLTTGGCDAGEKLHLPFVSEVDMTATWSITTGLITGGLLTYETGGTP